MQIALKALHIIVKFYFMKLSSPLVPEILFHVVVLENFGYFLVEHVNDVSNFKNCISHYVQDPVLII